MKKYIGIAIAVILIAGWVYLDFQWDDVRIKRYSAEGWTPAAIQDNAVIHPWNFVKCSVSGIWFVRDSSMVRLSDSIVIVEVLRVDRDTGASVGAELVDCASGKLAYLSEEEVASGDYSQVKWHSFEPKMPGGQLISFVTKQLESIPRHRAEPDPE